MKQRRQWAKQGGLCKGSTEGLACPKKLYKKNQSKGEKKTCRRKNSSIQTRAKFFIFCFLSAFPLASVSFCFSSVAGALKKELRFVLILSRVELRIYEEIPQRYTVQKVPNRRTKGSARFQERN
jgi:hypothetical protein